MLLFLDQMFRVELAEELRGAGHDVVRVKVNPTTTANVLKVLRPLLAGRTEEDFANHLVIASASRARWIRTGPS